jgi:putative membrane protein
MRVMTKVIFKILTNVFVLLVVSYLVPGFKFDTIWATVVAAIVIGIVNTLIKPILQIIALPISIFTLGISAFLINVALLYGVSKIVSGFEINRFSTAIIASVLMSLVSWFLGKLAKD